MERSRGNSINSYLTELKGKEKDGGLKKLLKKCKKGGLPILELRIQKKMARDLSFCQDQTAELRKTKGPKRKGRGRKGVTLKRVRIEGRANLALFPERGRKTKTAPKKTGGENITKKRMDGGSDHLKTPVSFASGQKRHQGGGELQALGRTGQGHQ